MKMKINLLNLSRCKQTELDLPCTDTDMQEKIEEAGIENDPLRPRVMIDLIEPVRLNGLSGSTVSLDELNFLAKRLDSFTQQEMEQFYMGVQYGGSLLLKDLINLTYNLHKYVLVRDVSSPEKIGLAYELQHEGSVSVDYEKTEACRELGKTLIESGRGIMTNHGLLFIDDKPMEEVYDGQVFPTYQYAGNSLISAEIDYDGKVETVYLPTEDLSIRKAIARLGAESLDDCAIGIDQMRIGDDTMAERIQNIINREGFFEANHLLQTISAKQVDMVKLDAVAAFAHVEMAGNLQYLAEHLNEFVFLSNVHTEEEYGHHLVDNDQAYAMNPDMEEFIDFESFGESMMEEHDAEFVKDSLLYYDGRESLSNFLCGLEPEDGGFKMTMG